MERVHVTSLFTEEELQNALDEGLVTKRKHPTLDLWIYNYSATCQFSWVWTPVTLNCRGLVLDKDLNIIARSLPKFFSYEQLAGKLPEGVFSVEEKMDGSMLIAFNYNGELVTATRGSFESEQAIKGKELLLNGRDLDWVPEEGETYVFEVIFRENKIVVDYDFEDVVLLTIVSLDGTEELDYVLRDYAFADNFRTPKVYSFNSLEEILSYDEPNLEGFVLRYESGERVKIKREEYKRLHRLLTGFNEKNVWENLKNGTLETLLEDVPDEFYGFVRETQEIIETNFQEIEKSAIEYFVDLGDRKQNAIFYQTYTYPAILFHMLDGKDYKEIIWKLVRPKVTQTFKIVNEDSN